MKGSRRNRSKSDAGSGDAPPLPQYEASSKHCEPCHRTNSTQPNKCDQDGLVAYCRNELVGLGVESREHTCGERQSGKRTRREFGEIGHWSSLPDFEMEPSGPVMPISRALLAPGS